MSIRELRRERGWSQERLADNSGLSLRTIQRIESTNHAGNESIRALSVAIGVDSTALELELSLDKASVGWKRRPGWVRAIYVGSGRIQMGRKQHILIERFAVCAGLVFACVAAFIDDSRTLPMVSFACMMFLCAYFMALFVRVGDRYSVWPWVESQESARAAEKSG